MSQPSSVEVLVHIAAPSGPKDDAQYRAHADACLGFKSATRLRIHPDLNDDDGDGDDGSKRVGAADERGGREIGHDEGLRGTFDELDMSYTFTKLSADSSGQDATQTQPDSSSGGQEGGSDRNAIDDSVEYLPIETARHQASSGDRTIATQFTSGRLQVINSDSSFQTPPSTVPETPQPVLHGETPTATHSPTPTPTPTATWDVEKNDSPDNGPIKAFQHPPSFPSTNEGPSPLKRRRLASTAESAASASFGSCNPSFASLVGVSTPQSPTTVIISSQPSHTEQSISTNPPNPVLEILPPPPVASSTAKFKTHITPSLRMLLDHPKLSRRYSPIYEARPVDKGERGYWSLPISVVKDSAIPNADIDKLQIPNKDHNRTNLNSSVTTNTQTGNERPNSARTERTGVGKNAKPTNHSCWTSASFSSFWDYLTKYIAQEGRAGWGVWCVCETPSTSFSTSGSELSGDSITTLDVRIYTWGEIISHTYLLILLASHRRIGKLPNVEWRDAGGDTVIRMS